MLFHRTVHLFSLTKTENMDSFGGEQFVASMVSNRRFISIKSHFTYGRAIAPKADQIWPSSSSHRRLKWHSAHQHRSDYDERDWWNFLPWTELSMVPIRMLIKSHSTEGQEKHVREIRKDHDFATRDTCRQVDHEYAWQNEVQAQFSSEQFKTLIGALSV
jgi:hypothetical protein